MRRSRDPRFAPPPPDPTAPALRGIPPALALCAQALWQTKQEKPNVPKDSVDKHRYWKEVAPYFLLEAAAEGKMKRPTALVVDEGQDFSPLWWDVLTTLLADETNGRLLVFFDPSQSIFGEPCMVPEMSATLSLSKNFRNTKRIAETVAALGNVKMTSFERCPEGVPPETKKQESSKKAQAQLAELLKQLIKADRLLPDQITILTPHTRDHSLLANLTELAGIPLASDPLDRAHAVLHTTIGAFKGLESDVIILADVDPDNPRCNRNARYVAASRAKHRLFVFSRGEWLG